MKKPCSNDSGGNLLGFSGLLYKVLGVLLFTFPIVAISNVLSEIWRFFEFPVYMYYIGAWGIPILRIGDSSAFIPTLPLGPIIFPLNTGLEFTVLNVIIVVVLVLLVHGVFFAALLYMRIIFRELKNGVSPFEKKMVDRVLTLAWIATFINIFEAVNLNLSLINISLMITTWLMYYIFRHGQNLQDESDTTL